MNQIDPALGCSGCAFLYKQYVYQFSLAIAEAKEKEPTGFTVL